MAVAALAINGQGLGHLIRSSVVSQALASVGERPVIFSGGEYQPAGLAQFPVRAVPSLWGVTDEIRKRVDSELASMASISSQTTLSGPADCGNRDRAPRQKPPDSDKRPATIDELLLEANSKNSSLANCNLLHVGIGNSRLATRLSSSCRHVTGVTLEETEQARAAGLGFENYRPAVCNKYSEEFRTHLPLDAYDVIVDSSLVSEGCCQRHWKALMQNYVELLAPTGSLVTARESVNCSPAGGWAPSEGDLVCLAGQFGMCVTKTGYGVYTLRRQHGV